MSQSFEHTSRTAYLGTVQNKAACLINEWPGTAGVKSLQEYLIHITDIYMHKATTPVFFLSVLTPSISTNP